MDEAEQAELLLQRCRHKLSGKEIEECERIANGSRQACTIFRYPAADGSMDQSCDYLFTRLCTEFAEFLR